MRLPLSLLLLFVLVLPMWAQDEDPIPTLWSQPSTRLVRPGWTGWDLRTTNLLKCSEDFSCAAWSAISLTVSVDTTGAPDGSQTADTLTTSGSGGQRVISDVVFRSSAFTYSVYAKKGTATNLTLLVYDLTNSAVLVTQKFSTVSTSWQRFSISGVAGDVNLRLYLYVDNDAENPAGSTMYLWGAQLNEGSTALPYVATTDLARVAVGPDLRGAIPFRREYIYNYLLHSEDLSNSVWTKNVTISADSTAAPDGTLTADTVSFTNGSSEVYQAVSMVAGASYTFSGYCKSDSSQAMRINFFNGSSHQYENVTCTSEWTRFYTTRTAGGSSGYVYLVGAASGAGPVYAWGLQFERN